MLPKGLLKEYARPLSFFLRGLDSLAIFLSGWFAYFLKFHYLNVPLYYLSALFLAAFFTPIVFSFCRIYESVRAKGFASHLMNLLKATVILFILLSGLAFFTKTGELFSRAWLTLWFLNGLVFLSLFRLLLVVLLHTMRSRGWNERRVVIIGAGELAQKLAETLQQSLWTGFRIVGFLDEHSTSSILSIPVEKMPTDLARYLFERKEWIDEVWLALPLKEEARVNAIMHSLRHETVTVRYVLDIFGMSLLNQPMNVLAGFPMVNIRTTPMMGVNRLIKAIEDRVLAAFILVLISPLLAMIAIAVKLSSKGPVFYRQERISWNGKAFDMLKFRTMPVNAEAASGPVWAKAGENRATKVGAFLRKTSLDELPQFINVLKGQMSIVGPRPERKVFVDQFKDQIPHYMQKHLVKAGITGWAQVNGWRGNTSLEKRIEFDLYYIENWSLWLDLKIIFLTFIQGFVNKNAY